MKTFVAIFLGFAIFQIILADFQVDTFAPVIIEQPKDSKPNNDLGITENLTDIPPEQNDILNDSIIPTLDELTDKSDPLQLAQGIKQITDLEKRNRLVAELKQAWIDNKDTLPGKFYQAAYASLKYPAEGAKYWETELKKATDNVVKSGMEIVDRPMSGIGDGIGNVRKFIELDPLGLAILQGNSVLLTILSDASKNTGKILDLVFDTAGNVVAIHRKLTAPLDRIPVFGGVKNFVDRYVAESLRRAKYVGGAFADTGTKAFATLANDSDEKAEKKRKTMETI